MQDMQMRRVNEGIELGELIVGSPRPDMPPPPPLARAAAEYCAAAARRLARREARLERRRARRRTLWEARIRESLAKYPALAGHVLAYRSAPWAIAECRECLREALSLAKGRYQEGVIMGWESVSGSTLRGRASHYGAGYAESRRHLLTRLSQKGIPVAIVRACRRDVLVIGRPDPHPHTDQQ